MSNEKSEVLTRLKDPTIEKLEQERDILYNNLLLVRNRFNRDKIKYRKKANRFKKERNDYRNVVKSLEKFLIDAFNISQDIQYVNVLTELQNLYKANNIEGDIDDERNNV